MFAVSNEHLPLRWNLCTSYLYSKLSTFICRLGSVFIAVIKDCGGKWGKFNTGHLFFRMKLFRLLGKNHPDVAALCVKFVKFTFLPAVVIFCFCVYLGEKVKNFKAFKFEPRAFKTWWTFKVSEPPHGTVTKNNNNDNYKLLWCCSRFKTQWCWLVQRAPDITDDWLALMENFVQICFFCYIEVKKDALTIYSFIYLYNYFFKKNVQKEKKIKRRKKETYTKSSANSSHWLLQSLLEKRWKRYCTLQKHLNLSLHVLFCFKYLF